MSDPDRSRRFRHVGDRLVHQGFIWSTVVASFAGPDGETFDRDVVRSPGAVGVLPVLFDPRGAAVGVMVRQYRGAIDAEMLEIPAGMRDVPGEPPEVTAQRELAEEAGFTAGSLRLLTRFHPSAGMTDSTTHVFLATDLSAVPIDRHGPEEHHMTIEHVPLVELAAMVERGEITDAKTVIAILMARVQLGA